MNIPKHVDTLVFSTSEDHIDENFYYVTGVSKEKHASAVVVVKNSTTVLTNRLEHGLFSGKKIIVENRGQLESNLRRLCGKKIGMDLSSVSANSLKGFRKILGNNIIDVSKEMGQVREIKSGNEIRKIKEACKITLEVLDDIEKILKRCRTERDLALELKYAAERKGAEGAAYPPVVAFGRNSALPHHSAGNTRLAKGLLLIDFGVVYEGYCSDITRMFSLGRADGKMKKIYNIVYKAQQTGIGKMNAGANTREIFDAANSILKKELHQDLIHSFGHGLGIEVHDYPGGISSKSKLLLRKNMVITAEPGFYDSAWGGVRIEDDIVVDKRAVRLTKAPPKITELIV